ncbi:hypothetical protein BBK36DRAFT_1107150 [Trichoderma citrinoviride]|uniref:DUF7702 domain-containing protein n=1 Tax=Trichoderma citrinoviride TaxID=58853 RepID=A0A2T4BLG1_9HYPO|nr:hypothetical protein BBK36DRAFT_1107150 [Trichoderma citrinoviride]PTB70147.1 hypothetical protein BBK36DRAFT_1107150 [Trichoderma citrinoviride]
MTTDGLSAAKLAIYLVLLQPALFCLWKHGKTGFLGWLFVQAFCVLRIVTGGIGLHGSQKGEAALILGSIGLSPLLLAISGILYEARRAVNPRLDRKRDVILEIMYHSIVNLGMILIIIALVKLKDGDSASKSKTMLYVGLALSCIAWGLVTLWAVWSNLMVREYSSYASMQTVDNGKILIKGIFVALPFLAIRLVYGVVFLHLQVTHPNSGFLTSQAVQICLSFLPEVICITILLLIGVVTRSLRPDLKKREQEAIGLVSGQENVLHQRTDYK